MTTLNAPQPPPSNNTPDNPACWAALLADGGIEPWLLELIEERDAMGRAKYGMPLRAWNGRDAAADALQEALDLAVYLQQCMMRVPEPDPRGWAPYHAHDRLKHMRNTALWLVRELRALHPRIPIEKPR